MLITMKHGTKSLEMGKHVNVLIPEKKAPEGGFPVLYLLHGYFGDYTDWLYMSNIIRYVESYDLVVVMPDGANSYYTDHPKGLQYHQYIVEDLRMRIEETFPISAKKEHRFIAGLSMGGFGALHIGLSHPDIYSKVISLSGVIDIDAMKPKFNEGERVYQFETLFGEGTKENPTLNLKALALKSYQQEIYLSCGKEDFLIEDNRAFHRFLEDNNILHRYIEDNGGHTWLYWDKHIKSVLAFVMT